ncbi:MAG: hypothetical protein EOP84_11750, partial [Verrucomicrobiaceae bacterium]
GRVGEWESGRVGEWESGRVGEWESGTGRALAPRVPFGRPGGGSFALYPEGITEGSPGEQTHKT